MPDFKVTQLDQKGKRSVRTVSAENEAEVLRRIREQGGFMLECRPAALKNVQKLKTGQLADFCRQFGSLLGAGVPMVRGLSIIAEEESVPLQEAEVLRAVLADLKNGLSLSVSMEAQRGAFPPLLIHMFRAAEESGSLENAAKTMARHYESQHRLDEKVKSSLLYPKILMGMLVLVVMAICAFVLPQFKSMFDAMETLPLPTRIMIGLSDLVRYRWYFLIFGAAVLAILLHIVLQMPAVRRFTNRMALTLPRIGKLNKTIATARFARTLSSLYSGGVPLMRAMQITRDTTENAYIAAQFDEAINILRRGGLLSEAIDSIDGFNTKLKSAVQVGEESGSLDQMLTQMADSLDYDAEMAMTRLVAMLEPVMMILMGLVVLGVIVGVMLPIYQSYNTIGASNAY